MTVRIGRWPTFPFWPVNYDLVPFSPFIVADQDTGRARENVRSRQLGTGSWANLQNEVPLYFFGHLTPASQQTAQSLSSAVPVGQAPDVGSWTYLPFDTSLDNDINVPTQAVPSGGLKRSKRSIRVHERMTAFGKQQGQRE